MVEGLSLLILRKVMMKKKMENNFGKRKKMNMKIEKNHRELFQ